MHCAYEKRENKNSTILHVCALSTAKYEPYLSLNGQRLALDEKKRWVRDHLSGRMYLFGF